MRLHLNNGKNRTTFVGAPAYGYELNGVTFDSEDLHKLLLMKDGELREYLGILATRFRPASPTFNLVKDH